MRHLRILLVLLPLGLLCGRSSAAEENPATGASPERVFNLEDSIRYALLNDAQFLSAEQDIKIAEQRLKEARLLFYPEIGFGMNATTFHSERPFVLQPEFGSLFIQPNVGRDEQLYAGRAFFLHNLYSGGRTTNTLRLAQAALKQARARYDTARLDAIFEVKKVFCESLFLQDKSLLLRHRIEETEKGLDAPGLTAWARLEAETLIESLRASESGTRHALEMARLGFLKAVNLELDTQVRLEGTLDTKPVPLDIETMSVWAMELRPELQSEAYKAQMDAIAVNLAFARRLPSVYLGADYEYLGRTFPLRQNNWDMTIGIRVPITYDFLTHLKQRRAEMRQGQIKRGELQDQVKLQVHLAYQGMAYWQGEWQRRLAALQKARELQAAAEKSSAPSFEKARALKGLTDIEILQLEAVKEHLLAKALLERAVGRPLE